MGHSVPVAHISAANYTQGFSNNRSTTAGLQVGSLDLKHLRPISSFTPFVLSLLLEVPVPLHQALDREELCEEFVRLRLSGG